MGHHLGDIFLWSNIRVSCDYNTLFIPSLHCGMLEETVLKLLYVPLSLFAAFSLLLQTYSVAEDTLALTLRGLSPLFDDLSNCSQRTASRDQWRENQSATEIKRLNISILSALHPLPC